MTTSYQYFCPNCGWHGSQEDVGIVPSHEEDRGYSWMCPSCGSSSVELKGGEDGQSTHED